MTGEQTFSFETVACLLAVLEDGGIVLGNKHYELMAKLDGKKSHHAFQHLFRKVKTRAKEVQKELPNVKNTPPDATSAKRSNVKNTSDTTPAKKSTVNDTSDTTPAKRSTVGAATPATKKRKHADIDVAEEDQVNDAASDKKVKTEMNDMEDFFDSVEQLPEDFEF